VAYKEKQLSNRKNFSAPLAIDSQFVHSAVANSNKRPLTELCAPTQFVSKKPTAVRDGTVTLKGSHSK